MKKFIAVMLVSAIGGLLMGCDYCIENPGEKEIQTNGMGARNGTEQLQRDHLVLIRRINKIDKSLDQIYSMICDLETKFMGNDRMEQITNPDHIPETVRQEIWAKKQRKEYINNLNEHMKNVKGWIPYKDK